MMDVEEKRRLKRIRHAEPVSFRYKDRDEFLGTLCRDISESGIRIFSNEFLPLNSEISLQISLSLGNMVECCGRVVWIQKLPFMDRYHVGLEFLEGESIFATQKEIHHLIQFSRFKE